MKLTTDWQTFGFYKPAKLSNSKKDSRTAKGRRRLRQRRQRRELKQLGLIP